MKPSSVPDVERGHRETRGGHRSLTNCMMGRRRRVIIFSSHGIGGGGKGSGHRHTIPSRG